MVLRELSILEQEHKKLLAELEKYKELDPDTFEKKSKSKFSLFRREGDACPP